MRKRPPWRERQPIGTKAADEQEHQRHHREQDERSTDARGEQPSCAERTTGSKR
jgi:hypothetical protein